MQAIDEIFSLLHFSRLMTYCNLVHLCSLNEDRQALAFLCAGKIRMLSSLRLLIYTNSARKIRGRIAIGRREGSPAGAHRRFAMQRALRTVTLENDRYARTLQGDPPRGRGSQRRGCVGRLCPLMWTRALRWPAVEIEPIKATRPVGGEGAGIGHWRSASF